MSVQVQSLQQLQEARQVVPMRFQLLRTAQSGEAFELRSALAALSSKRFLHVLQESGKPGSRNAGASSRFQGKLENDLILLKAGQKHLLKGPVYRVPQ